MSDLSYVPHFKASIRAVFDSMIQMELVIGESSSGGPSRTYDVSGIIGFSGDVAGTVAIRLGEGVALAIVRKFAGIDCEMESPDFLDAVGEIVNMIAGAAKAKFEGRNVSISTPSVVVGSGHRVACPAKTTCVSIPCRLSCGEFSVDVAIRAFEAIRNAA